MHNKNRHLIILVTLLFLTLLSNSFTENIVSMFDRTSTIESNLLKKFTGEISDNDVPEIIDWSYAGYKNGTEGIPDVMMDSRYEIIDVTDFGAIPNDGQEDLPSIKKAVASAKKYTIVFIPPGVYDLNVEPNSSKVEGASSQSIIIMNDHVVIKGAGAIGAEHGGTTLKLHTPYDHYLGYIFGTKWKDWHIREPTNPIKEYPRGVMAFEVQNAQRISQHYHSGRKKFVRIFQQVSEGIMYDANVSREPHQVPATYTNFHSNGVTIDEVHEIVDVIDNTIYVKVPLTTPLTQNTMVDINDNHVGLGIEDIHIDCGLNVPFTHEFNGQPNGKDGQYGHNGINLGYSAHSWIRNLRISNSSHGIRAGIYCNTVSNVFFDGNRGHTPINIYRGSRIFVGLVHCNTDIQSWHGIAVEGSATGNVYWMVGGPTSQGPDTHANFPRFTLFDNCFSIRHQASGSATRNRPFHLDGYTKWNNITTSSSVFDLWGNYTVTQANIIGYESCGSNTKNAYVESLGTPVTPNSLYVAQLTRRLGYTPSWIEEIKKEYNDLYHDITHLIYNKPIADPIGCPGPKIEGPWLWMLVRDASLDDSTDLLAKASGGIVTEESISTHGATIGGKIGDYQWTPLSISGTGNNNIQDMARQIKWNGNNQVIYGFVPLKSPRQQLINMYVGSDDSVKVWLNGELVHKNITSRGAADYQESFPVTLKQGKNILLVAVGQGVGRWSGFFGFQANAEYTILPVDSYTTLPGDVNGDGQVNILDLVYVANNFGKSASDNPLADVNYDGKIDILDLVFVANHLGESLDSGSPSIDRIEGLMELDGALVQTWIEQAQSENDGSLTFEKGIETLQYILKLLHPKEIAVMQNYPNPFNPETWIPYQLSNPSDVSITIYDIRGNVVRQLNLGYQSAGFYTDRTRAAHWDGKNSTGELVASGPYFYQVKAGNYTFLRKMLIMK